jgi:hypothetical protein
MQDFVAPETMEEESDHLMRSSILRRIQSDSEEVAVSAIIPDRVLAVCEYIETIWKFVAPKSQTNYVQYHLSKLHSPLPPSVSFLLSQRIDPPKENTIFRCRP